MLCVYVSIAFLIGLFSGVGTITFMVGRSEKLYTQEEYDELHDRWRKEYKTSSDEWSKLCKELNETNKRLSDDNKELRRRLNEI